MGGTLLLWSSGTLYLECLCLCLWSQFFLAAMCWLTNTDSGELILCIPSPAKLSGSCSSSFKSATVGIFTPWKLANATNQGLGFVVVPPPKSAHHTVFVFSSPPLPSCQCLSLSLCFFQSLPLPQRHFPTHLSTGVQDHILRGSSLHLALNVPRSPCLSTSYTHVRKPGPHRITVLSKSGGDRALRAVQFCLLATLSTRPGLTLSP